MVCDLGIPVPRYLAEKILRPYGFDVPETYGGLRPWMRRAWERDCDEGGICADGLFLAVAAGVCHANRKSAPRWVCDLFHAWPERGRHLVYARLLLRDPGLRAAFESAGALGGIRAQGQFLAGLELPDAATGGG